MKEHDATEIAYKNGYKKGVEELTSKTKTQDIVITELRKLLDKANHDAYRYALKIKELTEENEMLKSLHTAACEVVKIDTVQKMHSEIKKRCIKGGIYPAFVARTIDQIAKDMSKTKECPNCDHFVGCESYGRVCGKYEGE